MPTKETWTSTNDDEKIWLAKRASLTASSPSVLDFDKTRTAVITDPRKEMIAALVACKALGLDDDPSGRREAYLDAITPFEDSTGLKPGLSGGRSTGSAACPNSSSCGMLIRGLWQLLGAGKPRASGNDRNFRGAYVGSVVILNLLRYAEDCGALTGKSDQTGVLDPKEAKNWKKGDILFVAKDKTPTDAAHQHIFTLVEDPKSGPKLFGKFDTFTLESIDGGAAQTSADMKAGIHANDSNCRSIQAVSRQVVLHATEMRIAFPLWGEAQVRAWIDISKIPFEVPPIVPVRKP